MSTTKKLYEYTVGWSVEGGFQLAYVYVNTDTKTHAKNIIKDKLGNREDFYLNVDCCVYYSVRKDIPDNNILVWYFDADKIERKEIL